MSFHSGIIYSDNNFVLPVHMNYGRYFLEQISKYEDKIAMINGTDGKQITYGEMAQQIINVAGYLKKINVKEGEIVAVCSENRMEFMVAAIAAVYIGAVVTFINPAYIKGEILHAIGISKPRYVFFSPNAFEKHFTSFVNTKIVRLFFIFGDTTPNRNKVTCFQNLTKAFTDPKSLRPADFYGKPRTAFILYSSGTTGLAKGAKITHLNMIAVAQQPEPTVRDLRALSVAPWCNCMGLVCTTDFLIHGKTVIVLSRYNEELYLETIEKYKAGLLLVVPPLLIALNKSTILDNYDTSSVEIMLCGGAPIDPETISKTKKRFPNLRFMLQGYGMTEATGSLTEETETINKQGSAGKITPGTIVKIVDTETEKLLGPNQPGEVFVKGPVLFDGYVGKELELDHDGFYKTGDIAYYDEEGFFYIVDRVKELIKYKAWQVPPSELEAVILQHPAVKDVGVIGIRDKEAGEKPFAFVVKKGRVTEKELMDYVASKVSPWKQLRGGVKFIEEIPKNGSGKILRRKLREMLNKIRSKL